MFKLTHYHDYSKHELSHRRSIECTVMYTREYTPLLSELFFSLSATHNSRIARIVLLCWLVYKATTTTKKKKEKNGLIVCHVLSSINQPSPSMRSVPRKQQTSIRIQRIFALTPLPAASWVIGALSPPNICLQLSKSARKKLFFRKCYAEKFGSKNP